MAVLSPEVALVVSALVVLAIILAWKAFKLAIKVTVVAVAIFVILYLLKVGGVIDVPLPFT